MRPLMVNQTLIVAGGLSCEQKTSSSWVRAIMDAYVALLFFTLNWKWKYLSACFGTLQVVDWLEAHYSTMNPEEYKELKERFQSQDPDAQIGL